MLRLIRNDAEAPRLLTLCDYLDQLSQGARLIPTPPALMACAERTARALWSTLDLGAWPSKPPEPVSTFVSNATGKTLVHWPAVRRDCFLILVFVDDQSAPTDFVLFDIGAMYVKATLICPVFGIEDVAERATIRDCLPRLAGAGEEAFAVLELREGTYLQCYPAGDRFHLEHQIVSGASHWGTVEPMTADAAVAAFESYAFGNNEWARAHAWEKME